MKLKLSCRLEVFIGFHSGFEIEDISLSGKVSQNLHQTLRVINFTPAAPDQFVSLLLLSKTRVKFLLDLHYSCSLRRNFVLFPRMFTLNLRVVHHQIFIHLDCALQHIIYFYGNYSVQRVLPRTFSIQCAPFLMLGDPVVTQFKV